jgi:DNA-3-methyladenine glycosylase I
MNRCKWVNLKNEKYVHYHDTVWGVSEHDDYKLYGKLIMDGAQAGLSWETILMREEGYKEAFCNFDFEKVAKFTDKDVEKLMKFDGIIKNRLKINSAIKNAKGVIEIRKEFGSFDKYLWSFVDFKPIQNNIQDSAHIQAETEISQKLSKDLKRRGFSFVGPTIIYAYMQAIGIVNDHLSQCFRYEEVQKL